MHNGICGSFLPKYERQIRLLLIHAQQQGEVRGNDKDKQTPETSTNPPWLRPLGPPRDLAAWQKPGIGPRLTAPSLGRLA